MAVTISGSGVVTGLDSANSTDLGASLDAAGGLVMVSPATIANSGGTATLTDGAVSFSGVSSVSLNDVFTSAYDNYRLLIDISTASGTNVVPSLQLRASGSNASTNYEQSRFLSGASGISNVNPDGTTLWGLGYISSTDVDEASCNLEIYRPFLERITTSQAHLYHATGNLAGYAFGYHNAATSYDGFTFSISSGTITGTIRVYGYRNGI